MAVFRKRSPGRVVLGQEDLDRRLAVFDVKTANRIARAVLRSGLTPIERAIKQKTRFIGIQKAIGSRVGSGKGRGRAGGVTRARVGAAVGKKEARRDPTTDDLPQTSGRIEPGLGINSKATRRGKGIGAANIHWWILGTGPRTQKKTGRRTGVMPPQKPIVKSGFSAAAGKAEAKMRAAFTRGLIRELKRAR